jgi:hypothetical protein
MYKLRPLDKGEVPDENAVTPQNQGTKVTPEGDGSEKSDQQDNKPGINIGKFIMDPRVAAIAYNTYANTVNDTMVNRSIDAAKRSLTLYDPKNTTKYLQGNLDAEMQGEKAAGQLLHIASQPLTSDGALHTAAYTDSVSKAQDYIIQGRSVNNEALRKSAEELWQLRKEDDDFNYNVAMRNRQSIGDLIDNIANIENAGDSRKYTNNSVLFDEIMQPVKQEANRKKDLEERLAMSDIHNDVRYNLNKYTHLTADEEEAWNAVLSGDKRFSELGGSDVEAKKRLQRAYLNADRKASEIEQDKMANYYGVSRSYRNVREMAQSNTPWTPPKLEKSGGILSAKDGAAKIAVAKIRERAKDADRFHKTTKDKQDRNEKAIARADKKMYSRRDFIKRGKK